ncbi:MAG: adenylate/guanylate cyclase domain-containing protein [Cellulomonadaceae bacterium]
MPSDWSEAAESLTERLLGGPRHLSLDEVARADGVGRQVVQRYWQLIGLPVTEPSAPEFTDDDAASIAQLLGVAGAEGLDDRTLTSLVRSVGHGTERLALWQFEALVDHMSRSRGVDDPEARLLVLRELDRLVPALEEQLVHAWRRQMAALVGRIQAEFGRELPPAEADGDGAGLPLPRAVGFADIVSFTRMTASMRPREFTSFIQAFEARARDIVVANGGRVVKTVGDALLFIADDVVTGARVALGLAEAVETAPGHEAAGIAGRPVRVSLVWGRVLSRFGDVFGAPVNLASRLTDEAEPSSVLTDPDTAALLAGERGLRLVPLSPRDVPGLGPIVPVRLERAI